MVDMITNAFQTKYVRTKNDYLRLKNIQNGGKKDKHIKHEKRIKTYHELATSLNYMSNNDIDNLLDSTKDKSKGTGLNYVVSIDKINVFVKKLKVTQKEYDRMFDSSNMFDLSVFYNYGVGSYGMNIWRELLMHVKTTHNVLNNECTNFPLMYHYRIIKDTKHRKQNMIKKNDYYIKYWNSNDNIKKYLDEKNKSDFTLIIFLEHFPYTLRDWILKSKNIEKYYYQAYDIISFLNKKNILHFDAHLGNFVVDNDEILYLIDYGLVIDKDFDLTKDEIKFFDQNIQYDKYMICHNIINAIYDVMTDGSNRKKYQKMFGNDFSKNTKSGIVFGVIKENYQTILDLEKIKYDKSTIKKLVKHGFVFRRFLNKMRNDQTKSGTLSEWIKK